MSDTPTSQLINGSFCTEHHVYLCDECRIADFKEQIGSLTARLAEAEQRVEQQSHALRLAYDHRTQLEAKLAEAEQERTSLAEGQPLAFEDRSVAEELKVLRKYWTDTLDPMSDWPCLPECDSYAHAEACPHINPAHAFRKMIEALAAAREEVAGLRELRQSVEKIGYVTTALLNYPNALQFYEAALRLAGEREQLSAKERG